MKSKKQHGPCSIIGCGIPIYAKCLCNKHWQQMRNMGEIRRCRSEKNEYYIFNNLVLLKMDRKKENTEISYAVIDLEDFEKCKKFKWHLDGKGYATTKVNGIHCKLHNFLMQPPLGNCGDHINHKPLDNRRCNLRYATQQQNSFNQKLRIDSKSGYKGVTWCGSTQKWRARIRVNGKELYLGSFTSPEEAARMYDKEAKKHHGQFGVLYFPLSSWTRRQKPVAEVSAEKPAKKAKAEAAAS